MMKNNLVLVIGGAGYIGSHMVDYLMTTGWEPIVFDNLSTGHRWAVEKDRLFVGDLSDPKSIDTVFQKYSFTAVMHFGGSICVSESVNEPAKYYQNNVTHTLNLLEAMLAHQVKHFIFSSSAAVYGVPEYHPLDINHPTQPCNPYGRSKWMIEELLEDFDVAYDLKSICLRYFNAAGAHPEGKLGECHNPETHLIPLVLQAASGRRECVHVYGTHYPTEDGTCIRDFIHVMDLCRAHEQALKKLLAESKSEVYNLGTGAGFSVNQVIEVASQVTGKEIPVTYTQARPGDVPILVADATKAKTQLYWEPKYTSLRQMISDAWRWEQCLLNEVT